MALTFTNRMGSVNRTWKVTQGLVMTEVEMTTSTGANGADYSSGFDINGNKSRFGIRNIFRVGDITIVNGAGSTVLGTTGMWDHQSGKLRVVLSSTGAEDNGGGTLVTASSKIRFLVWGV